MKLIIAGGREISLPISLIEGLIFNFNLHPLELTEIVSGTARGMDTCGEKLAFSWGKSVKRFPPNYDKYPPKIAPIMRNKDMAKYADALFIVWDGESRGSNNMKDEMQKLNKPIFEIIIRNAKT